jgi:hypothetical protein
MALLGNSPNLHSDRPYYTVCRVTWVATMKGIARLSFQDGGLFLPVKTPYEREVLFEYADQYAKRHGRVRLEIDRRECVVRVHGEKPETCNTCGHRLDSVAYTVGAQTFCRFCARRDLE